MDIDANHVTAWLTGFMTVAACCSAYYAYGAVQKSKAANATADTAQKTADQAFKNSQGDSEILIHTSLSDALRRQDEAFVKLIEMQLNYPREKPDDEEHFAVKAYATLSESTVQGYLNAFDIACQRYLDGKLDKKRFKKTYGARIKELFSEEKGYKKFLLDISSTKYHALHTVNNQFHNLENSEN
jgi:cbb3-type cytochrome oxidase subunit 3